MSPGTIPTARPLRKLAYSRGLAVGMVCGESRASDEREAFGGCSPDDGDGKRRKPRIRRTRSVWRMQPGRWKDGMRRKPCIRRTRSDWRMQPGRWGGWYAAKAATRCTFKGKGDCARNRTIHRHAIAMESISQKSLYRPKQRAKNRKNGIHFA